MAGDATVTQGMRFGDRQGGRRRQHPTPVLLPGKSHGQRTLVGYCLQHRKESDTTERLYFLSFFHFMLPSEIPKLPTDPPVRGFPGVWKLLFKIPFPGQISIPNRFVFLFICYILFYLLLKTNGCLSGCLVSSASVQKLFCGICSVFK